jgi:hypothetical protein
LGDPRYREQLLAWKQEEQTGRRSSGMQSDLLGCQTAVGTWHTRGLAGARCHQQLLACDTLRNAPPQEVNASIVYMHCVVWPAHH